MTAADGDWEVSLRRVRRRRWPVAVLVIGLAAVIAVRAPSDPGDGGLQVEAEQDQGAGRPTAGPATGETPLAEGTWIGVPPPPVTWVRPPSVVWTGREVIVWGASLEGAAGAMFQPGSRTWRRLPEAPLDAREGHVATWVPAPQSDIGLGEMVVVGGRPLRGDRRGDGAGAAFNPRTATWRLIADAPMRIPRGASGTWTGSELIVTAGASYTTSEAHPPAAAYDPATDTWRPLPALPPGAWLDAVAWTGAHALAVLGQPGRQASVSVAAWDPELGVWRPRPGAPLGIASSASALSVTRGVVLWARSSDGRSRLWFMHADDRWTATEPAPLSDRTRPLLAWTGRHVVVLGGTDAKGTLADGAVYDTVEERWSLLPPAPRPVARPLAIVWTWSEVVVLGYSERGRATTLGAAWVPATLRP